MDVRNLISNPVRNTIPTESFEENTPESIVSSSNRKSKMPPPALAVNTASGCDFAVSGSGDAATSKTHMSSNTKRARGGTPAKVESPSSTLPKHVAFELLLDETLKMKARIPMRVQIFPHDTTDSIVTTVKNFYGIYEGTASGVSFEDIDGNTLIARYENLKNNMTVYVRVIANHGYPDNCSRQAYPELAPVDGYKGRTLGEPFQMAPPPADPQSANYPVSRVNGKRSASPQDRNGRSASKQKGSRYGNKSRGSSTHGSIPDEAHTLCNDSDSTHSSKSGIKRRRLDRFNSSEISMDNILQDGRRKRPKFDSSELPLFAPPQVPRTASMSSISPQRQSAALDASPFAKPVQPSFARFQPLTYPNGFIHHEKLHSLHGNNGINTPYATPSAPHHDRRLRNRANANAPINYTTPVHTQGILPTPDPTIASCISDEDVAMQLIRLGDASNFSHGRTSTSTNDDAFSRVAEAESTGVASSEVSDASGDEGEFIHKERGRQGSVDSLPPPKISKSLDDVLPSCESSDPTSDGVDGEYQQLTSQDNEPLYEEVTSRAKRAKKPNGASTATRKQTSSAKAGRNPKARPSVPSSRKGKSGQNQSNANINNKGGVPPPPLLPTAQKQSGVQFQNQLAPDEEDLSTKPRCQRCRKSKKGCDRQRPCQRCKDAGIGIEGCISEDECNGRKGRFGRHMGVSVKKEDGVSTATASPAPQEKAKIALPATQNREQAVPAPTVLSSAADKSKKRKR